MSKEQDQMLDQQAYVVRATVKTGCAGAGWMLTTGDEGLSVFFMIVVAVLFAKQKHSETERLVGGLTIAAPLVLYPIVRIAQWWGAA